jgi:hypothetical protein
MNTWNPVPEPVTWSLQAPVEFNGVRYSTVTLRAPTGDEVLKAASLPGSSGYEISLRLIGEVSAEQMPYEAVRKLPVWLTGKMTDYFDSFAGAPDPDPLEAWRTARREAAQAKATAEQAAAQPVS